MPINQTDKTRIKDELIRNYLYTGILSVRGSNVYTKFGRRLGSLNSKGYVSGHLRTRNINTTVSIHRVLCIHHHGLPSNHHLLQVNHKNGIKHDNRKSNLEWCTSLENTRHAIATGLRNSKGVNHANSILTEEQVALTLQLIHESTKSYTDIGKLVGIRRQYVASIASGRSWRHMTPRAHVSHKERKINHASTVESDFRGLRNKTPKYVKTSILSIKYALDMGILKVIPKRNDLPHILRQNAFGKLSRIYGSVTKNGYLTSYILTAKRCSCYMHQIVAVAILGLNPVGKSHIGFKDGNNKNYIKSNLYWKP